MKKFGTTLCAILAMCMFLAIASVAATETLKTIKVSENIKITVNGEAFSPEDSSGNVIKPFVYNGVAYVPMSAFATALGYNATYDSKTQSTAITKNAATEVKSETVPVSKSSTGNKTALNTVLYNKNGIKIIYKGFKLIDDGYDFAEINLTIENNSKKDYCIQTRDESISGFMCDVSLSCDVQPGKKANDSITIHEYEMENAGITSIPDIDFTFHIFNNDDWDDSFNSDVIKLVF